MKEKIYKHIEYTVTLACPEYDAGNPCPGCFLPKHQEQALKNDPRFKNKATEYEIDPTFIINILKKLDKEGYRIITLMGGEPLAMKKFNEVIKWISESNLTAALYVGLPRLFLTKAGKLNDTYTLYKEAGLFNKDRFGYLKFSANKLLLNKNNIPKKRGPERTSAVKTYYGLKVAELLAINGTPPAIHQTITRETIDQTLPLYQWAKERGIGFSCSPLVWAWRSPKYNSRKKLEAAFPYRLTETDKTKLEKISKVLFKDAVNQISKGQERLVIPSSAFLRFLPTHGINNNISCFPVSKDGLHRNGKRPEIKDIYPSGKRRYCIAQDAKEEAKKCLGCFGSAGVDRSNAFYEFESSQIKKGDIRFLNGDKYRKKQFD